MPELQEKYWNSECRICKKKKIGNLSVGTVRKKLEIRVSELEEKNWRSECRNYNKKIGDPSAGTITKLLEIRVPEP